MLPYMWHDAAALHNLNHGNRTIKAVNFTHWHYSPRRE